MAAFPGDGAHRRLCRHGDPSHRRPRSRAMPMATSASRSSASPSSARPSSVFQTWTIRRWPHLWRGDVHDSPGLGAVGLITSGAGRDIEQGALNFPCLYQRHDLLARLQPHPAGARAVRAGADHLPRTTCSTPTATALARFRSRLPPRWRTSATSSWPPRRSCLDAMRRGADAGDPGGSARRDGQEVKALTQRAARSKQGRSTR